MTSWDAVAVNAVRTGIASFRARTPTSRKAGRKALAPLRDAMRFIHDEVTEAARAKVPEVCSRHARLRGGKHDGYLSPLHPREQRFFFLSCQAAAQDRCLHAGPRSLRSWSAMRESSGTRTRVGPLRKKEGRWKQRRLVGSRGQDDDLRLAFQRVGDDKTLQRVQQRDPQPCARHFHEGIGCRLRLRERPVACFGAIMALQ